MKGIEVLSANTDGILVNLTNKIQKQKFKTICNTWEKITKMNLEYTYYDKYVRRDVNNYTALSTNNKTKNKGIFAPPDIKHDVKAPIIQKLARGALLYETEPSTWLEDHREELTIYDFLFHFGATNTFKVHLDDKPLSKTNRWYISNNGVSNQLAKTGGIRKNTINIPDGKNIVLCNKIENDDVPSDLDLDYYLEKANKLIRSCQNDTPR